MIPGDSTAYNRVRVHVYTDWRVLMVPKSDKVASVWAV